MIPLFFVLKPLRGFGGFFGIIKAMNKEQTLLVSRQAKKRIEKLKKEINHYNYLYHVLDSPEISDAAFDSLKHELQKLEQERSEYLTIKVSSILENITDARA